MSGILEANRQQSMGQGMRLKGVVSRLQETLSRGVAIAAVSAVLCASPAFAQSDDVPSQSAMVNLIHLLVKQGVITQKAGDALLRQAESEAAQARNAAPKQKGQTSVATLPMPETAAEPPPPPNGTVRVPYIPAVVKKQITEQVKQDVMAQAQAEGWAQPKSLPNWLKHVTFSGDMRFRDEQDLFGSNNVGYEFINYAAFNANGPTDVNPATLQNTIPFLNTTESRYNQLSIRVHLGLVAQVTDKVLFGIRLASGNDNGPVSTTQLLGGGLDKKNLWLDQAYTTLGPFAGASLTAGRMPNPFFHTDLVWDENLNFDGAQVSEQSKPAGAPGLGLFGTVGAFPIGYIGTNFPDQSINKAQDRTEWLLGAQAGTDWQTPLWDWRFGVSLYDYLNAQGQLSTPCAIYLGVKQCSTDDTRPAFMQKGNTLFLLRNIIPDPNAIGQNYTQPQFVGLAMNYNELDATTEFDIQTGHRYHLILDGDFVRNLAYDANVVNRYGPAGLPVTNYYSSQSKPFQSGPNAFMAQVTYGDPLPREQWQWNIVAGYKYLQPDAVLDAFTNADFTWAAPMPRDISSRRRWRSSTTRGSVRVGSAPTRFTARIMPSMYSSSTSIRGSDHAQSTRDSFRLADRRGPVRAMSVRPNDRRQVARPAARDRPATASTAGRSGVASGPKAAAEQERDALKAQLAAAKAQLAHGGADRGQVQALVGAGLEI